MSSFRNIKWLKDAPPNNWITEWIIQRWASSTPWIAWCCNSFHMAECSMGVFFVCLFKLQFLSHPCLGKMRNLCSNQLLSMHNSVLSKSIKYQKVEKDAISSIWGWKGKKRCFMFLLELAVKQIEQILKNKGPNLTEASLFLLGWTALCSCAHGFSFVKLLCKCFIPRLNLDVKSILENILSKVYERYKHISVLYLWKLPYTFTNYTCILHFSCFALIFGNVHT